MRSWPVKVMKKIINIFLQIMRLPKVKIDMGSSSTAASQYRYFTRRHPKYRIFGNKTMGVMLIRSEDHDSFEGYLDTVNGKNSAAYYRRKAMKLGYRFSTIDRNKYVDDIYEINTSKSERQGKEMSESYQTKTEQYEENPDSAYFGVVNSEGKLVSYLWLNLAGEVAIISTLLGHGDFLNDGIMYYIVAEAIGEALARPQVKYVMYDTYFGASEGLRKFKEKLGFQPHRVKWGISA